jgi:hypothetical protein
MRAKWWIPVATVAVLPTLTTSSFATAQRPGAILASQGNQAVFQDSVGDAPASADIATVLLSNDNAGFVSFQVVFAGKATRNVTVLAHLDTDQNASTGSRALFGADYEVAASDLSSGGSSFSLRRWNGKAFKEFYSVPPDIGLKGGVLTFAFDSSDLHLGPTRAFNFGLATQRTSSSVMLDQAPDAGKTPWSFQVKTTAVRLSVVGLSRTPATPRAGHVFVASMIVKPSAAVADLVFRIQGPTCTARIAHKSLQDHDSSVDGSAGSQKVAARCRWRIPSGTSGKLLRGSVKVTFMGKTLARTFSATIAK